MPRVRPETALDLPAIRTVNRLAFGREDEGRLVDALRSGGFVQVSLVAEDQGELIGHVLFSTMVIETSAGELKALALAPLAVVPSRQRQGIGSMLVREGLLACQNAGADVVIVVGEPLYYARFGFSAERAECLHSPFAGPAFQALGLVPGALNGVSGTVRYPPPFEAV